MKKINISKPKIHFFVCINDRSEKRKNDPNCFPSCGPKMNYNLVKEFKVWLSKKGLTKTVYCTKSGCLGFCNKSGGVAVVYPSGTFYSDLRSADDLKEIVRKELSNN